MNVIRDYQTADPASTDGLTDLFELACHCETCGLTTGCHCETAGNHLLTIAEAARKLGVPYTTFYRQVKAGKHSAVAGLDGKLRVSFPSNIQVTKEVTSGYSEVTTGVIEVTNDISEVTSPIAESVEQPAHLIMEKQLELIQQLQAQVQAASFRNGYLESKLEERDQAIKRLTDSQHKPSWWSKFASWFFKAQ
ncbi:MAG: helix-turn-helix domain-containing protein [Candidatus Obscuribacterales bacterium]|nr:helix-turn-helix domain-containing protein [Candidatus Obscuribacterales bacterium]